MKLRVKFPAAITPGQSWRVPESKLDDGLQIGSVHTATTTKGLEAQFLVDAAYRERDGLRYYDLVRLGDCMELRDAQPNLDALVSHVSRTGRRVTLTIDGAAAAMLTPAPILGDKKTVEAFHARLAKWSRSIERGSGNDVTAAGPPATRADDERAQAGPPTDPIAWREPDEPTPDPGTSPGHTASPDEA